MITAAILPTPLNPGVPTAAEPTAATYSNRHADLDPAIDSDNVGRMQLAWKVETDAPVSHVPLLQAGRVYVADWNGTAYAVDAESGNVVWQHALGLRHGARRPAGLGVPWDDGAVLRSARPR